MELWLIYAIISIFAAGLYSFGTKVAAERNYNASLIAIYYYFFAIIFTGGYLLYFGFSIEKMKLLLFLAFLNALFYFLSTITRIESMRHIDAVIFFPVFKVIGPILVTFVSIIYFSEQLTVKEIIGIIVGITVPLFLITKSESKVQNNLKVGIGFLVISAIFVSIAASTSKQVSINNLDINFFLIVNMIFGFLLALVSYNFFQKDEKHKEYNKKGIIQFSMMMSIFLLVSVFSFTKALTGNLAVVATINSFSILIPIILSVIFYKDDFNFKKGIVIILSVISIIMFI